MTWTSKYSATFTKSLIRQLMAVFQRDMQEALDWVGGIGQLPGIVSYQFAGRSIKQFPAILIAPSVSQFVPEAVGTRQSANQIYLAIGVTHQDEQRLVEMIQDYMRAADAVLSTMPLSDLYTALPLELPWTEAVITTPLEVGSVKDLFVASHNYDDSRFKGGAFQIAATMAIQIDREET